MLMPCLALSLLSPLLVPQEPAASLKALDTSGNSVPGLLASFDAEAASFVVEGRQQRLPWASLLWLRPNKGKPGQGAPLRLDLVSGGRLSARIIGGDEGGESFDIEMPVLGSRRLAIDLVQSIRVQVDGRVQAPERIRPSGDALREIFYRRIATGLDPVPGYLEGASNKGLLFQWTGAKEPKLYPWAEFGGLWLGEDAEARQAASKPMLRVVLSDDSVLRGRPKSFDGSTLILDGGDLGELRVPGKDCLFIHVEHPASRLPLSELSPKKVVERSFFGADAPVHWPWRRDRPVRDPSLLHNETLVTAGQVYLRGLGVHSRSELSYVVPAGVKRFVTLVGIDDGALQLERPGACEFRILLDGQLVREHKALRAGAAALLVDPLPVKPGQELRLVVDFGPAQHLGDRASWLEPCFVK